jgi:cytochrome c biogenesis protein CcmG, thiol:disulfide interchange protein DsbE
MRFMSFRTQAGLLWMALLLIAALPGQSEEKRAADFSLRTLDGKQLKLSDYAGKAVLLDFWATWCVPCQTEVPRFVAFQKQYATEGFQVIGISMDDSPEPVRKFYAKFKMNYPVALGNADVAKAYGGVLGLPLAFLISRDGTIIKQYDGSASLDDVEKDLRMALAAPRQ